jgi:hypothetical protein
MHRTVKIITGTVSAAALIGIGAAIGSAGSSNPAVTVTGQAVPGPTVTVTEPGDTTTVAPPPPEQGTVLKTFTNKGNQVTPAFNVPDDGDYIVTWSYSGNIDDSFGDSQPSNFAITEAGDGIGLGLPNDIAGSGSGSTEVTGADGTDRLNVQAVGSWMIQIKSAG